MQREGIEITQEKDGTKIINDFLRIHGKIGRGAYCKVHRGEGVYPAEPPEYPEEERIPYALKVYEKHTLKQFVNVSRAPTGDNPAAALGMRTLYDTV